MMMMAMQIHTNPKKNRPRRNHVYLLNILAKMVQLQNKD